MNINNIFIVYDKGWDWVVYLKSVENVITLGKMIGLLFLFCLSLLSILFLKTKRNDLARPVMGTIFLVLIGGLKFGDLVLSIVERYLIQCPLFGMSVKRDSTVLYLLPH